MPMPFQDLNLIIIFFLCFLVIIFFLGIRKIDCNKEYVLFRMDKKIRVIKNTGFYWVIPFIDKLEERY